MGRSLFQWAVVRAAVTLVGLVGGVTFPPAPGFSLRLALLMGILAFVDRTRRRERILLANLGVPTATVVAGAVVVALCAELLVAALLTLVPVR